MYSFKVLQRVSKCLQDGGTCEAFEIRLRICKIECHPLTRYSYPGEGTTVERSIANYIIIGKYDRMRKGMPNLQLIFTQDDAGEYDAGRIANHLKHVL